MIKRITLTDFMSHADTVIDLAPGLNVIVGANNLGKSAIVTALQILCRNDNSTYVVRHGRRECAVRVETNEGHVVEWRRKNNSPRYLIDGVEFSRLKMSNVPDELHQALRMPLVDEDDGEFDIHFAVQKSPIFLLDRPSSKAAQFFASSSDAQQLVAMQKRHREKEQEARRARDRIQLAAAETARQLEQIEPVVALGREVEACETAHQRLIDAQAGIAEGAKRLLSLRGQVRQVARLEARHRAIAEVEAPPALAEVGPVAKTVAELARAGAERREAAARHAALRELAPVPLIEDTRVLEELVGDVSEVEARVAKGRATVRATEKLAVAPELVETRPLEAAIRRLEGAERQAELGRRRVETVKRLAGPPALVDADALAECVRMLREGQARADGCRRSAGSLAALREAPGLDDPRLLGERIQQMEQAAVDIEKHGRERDAAAAALRDAEDALRAWAEAAGACPTCGQAVEADVLVAHAALGRGGHLHA